MTKPVSKKKIFFIIALGIILTAIVPLVRTIFYDSYLPSDIPYYDSAIANYIHEQGMPKYEPFMERNYVLQPYHLLLALFVPLLGNFALMLFPVIFGAIALVTFYFILKKLNFRHEKILFIMVVLILTPNFIYTFSIEGSQALALTLSLLTLYSFMHDKKSCRITAIVLCAIAPLFSMLNAAITIAVLLIYTLSEKEKRRHFIICAIAAAAVIILHANLYGIPKLTLFLQQSILRSFITDIGSLAGFSVFSLLLAIVGAYIIWRTKKHILAYEFIFLFIIASFYAGSVYAHLNFLFALFAGTALLALINMPWRIRAVKYLTIIILISGLALSTFSTISALATSQPHKEITESLLWLKSHTAQDDKIFSHYTKGFWIESVAQRRVLLDNNLAYTPNAAQLYNESNVLFSSRNLETTKALLDQHKIDYIMIDSQMKSGQVWAEPEEGLQFILANSEIFKKIYGKQGIEIWEYSGR